MSAVPAWEDIKAEMLAVLDMAPEARHERLDALRLANPALATEVESLLAHHKTSDEFLETPAWERAAVATTGAPPPERIGPWRIEAEIGRGGMGSVYRGRRDDGAFEQTVAIKLVRPELASELLRRRFLAERRILAGLEHPNIARLLDGGSTEAGVPFLVIEYIDGVTIDRYCDDHALPIDGRLQLFASVCSAVHYAHQKLVLHRDIKDGNVLVDRQGNPKLLDFGIAKLLAAEPADEALTALGTARPLTPEWASPEHLRDEPLTTASDVYSLGVLLHTLLIGRRPHRFSGGSPASMASEIERAGEVSIARASRHGVCPGVEARRLRGDLDRIVAKALAFEPQRRYATAAEFADDVARFLAARPVTAQPSTLGYRARKWVARHRAATIGAVVAVLSLLSAVVISVRQARIAEIERQRAERRFNDVRRLANVVFFDVHEALLNVSGALAARQLLVENALRYLEDLERDAADDADLLDEIAVGYGRIAEIQGMPGWPGKGNTGTAQGSLEKALALCRRAAALPGNRPDSARQREAGILSQIGSVLEARGEIREGLSRHREAAEILDGLHARSPSLKLLFDIALVQVAIGDDLWQLGESDGAVTNYRKALEASSAARAADPSSSTALRQIGVIEQRLGDAAADRGDWSTAREHHAASLDVDEELKRREPENQTLDRDLGTDLSRLGNDAFQMGDFEQALSAHRRAQEIRERLLAAEPNDALALADAAESSFQLARALFAIGKTAEAGAGAEVAIGRWRALVKIDPENTHTSRELARGLTELGRWEATKGDRARALALVGEAQGIWARRAAEHPDLAANRGEIESVEELLDALRHGRPLPAATLDTPMH